MNKTEVIEHIGAVSSIDHQFITIRITSASACSGCNSKGLCELSSKDDKIIKVAGKYDVAVGDTVKVVMQQSMGFNAVLLGYFLPFVAVLVILILMISLSVSELLSGVVAISTLIPYYFILFLLKDRLDKKFTFNIKTD
jgi:sigma-E factor negative regulatory protein RseC